MMLLFVGIALLALLALAGTGWYLSAVVSLPKFHTLEQVRQREIDAGVYGDFDTLPKTEYRIPMPDGYELHAALVPAKTPSDRYVIITHGYTSNRLGSVYYAHLFRRLGCNSVIFDNRGHGENARTFVTMGKREHRDLLCVIEDTRKRYGPSIRIGLHGESMGSATSVMALAAKPLVDFLVSDCGYADLPMLLQDLMRKQYRLPGWLIWPASVVSRFRFGFGYREIMPKNALIGNQIPVLFVHGDKDDFILPKHVHQFYAQAQCRKELLIVPGAAHAASVYRDPEGYEAAVRKFLAPIWPDIEG